MSKSTALALFAGLIGLYGILYWADHRDDPPRPFVNTTIQEAMKGISRF